MVFPNLNNTTGTFLTSTSKAEIRFSIFCLPIIFCLTPQVLYAAETTRISVASDGSQANSISFQPNISADGRYVAFCSMASHLVAADSNGVEDVFVKDRLTGKTSRVSVATGGTEGNNPSVKPSISANGRFVAFSSTASNLVAGDTNGQDDIFVHDRLTGQTSRVSVTTGGGQASSSNSSSSVGGPSLSADGRFVAFESDYRNMEANISNFFRDIYVHDRLTSHTSRVSVAVGGAEGDGHSFNPSLSADGRFVAFESRASNLASIRTPAFTDVFVHDRLMKQTSLISVAPNGVAGNLDSKGAKLNADGRFVTFASSASNLVIGDTNGLFDVFVHDRLTKKTRRVSVATDGTQANGQSSFYTDPGISGDGRYIGFVSQASNLIVGDASASWDVKLHDRLSGQTTRASVATDGTKGNNTSGWVSGPSLSADARFVVFDSLASNLVVGDTLGGTDIFVRDRLLNKNIKADLKISVAQKPVSIKKNGQGTFVYSIINNGSATVSSVRIYHTFSNGQMAALTPSKGTCKRYTAISLCDLGSLAVGAGATLTVDLKALRNPLAQYLSTSSNGPADLVPANNYLTVTTPVTP